MMKNSKHIVALVIMLITSVSAAEPATVATALPEDQASRRLMDEARQAFMDQNFDRAVALYTRLSETGTNSVRANALEFLGVTRERKKQRAQAKAVYQRYLALYPKSEGTQRVKQRLNALVSHAPMKNNVLEPDRADSDDDRWTLRGYHSNYFRSNTLQQGQQASIQNLSLWQGNIDLVVQRRGTETILSSRLNAGISQNFSDYGRSRDGIIVSKAYVDLSWLEHGLVGRLGRQSRSSGGVYGRFDGARVSWDVGKRITLNGVAGFPVRRSTLESFDSDRVMYGVSVDVDSKSKTWKYGLFANSHVVDGIADRRGVGGEFRYFAARKNLYGIIDYDTLYSSINALMLGGTLITSRSQSYFATIDYRRSPLLSTSNAIIGQGAASLNELSIGLSEEELRALAEDNTATSASATIGATIPLSQRLQWSTYIQLANLETAVSFQNFSVADPNNLTTSINMQLVASSLWRESDAWIVGVRIADSETFQSAAVSLNARFPISRTFRLNPLVRVLYRKHLFANTDEWILTPGLRAGWRWKNGSVLEFDSHYESARRGTAIGDQKRTSLYLSVGYRAGFGG